MCVSTALTLPSADLQRRRDLLRHWQFSRLLSGGLLTSRINHELFKVAAQHLTRIKVLFVSRDRLANGRGRWLAFGATLAVSGAMLYAQHAEPPRFVKKLEATAPHPTHAEPRTRTSCRAAAHRQLR